MRPRLGGLRWSESALIVTRTFDAGPQLVPRCRYTDKPSSLTSQLIGLCFFDDAVRVISLCRVQDPAVAEPERDVRRLLLVAVGDEVPAAELVLANGLAGVLLLIGIARHELAEAAVCHVDEARAVDAALGHPAPEVGRAEVGARLFDWSPSERGSRSHDQR